MVCEPLRVNFTKQSAMKVALSAKATTPACVPSPATLELMVHSTIQLWM